MKAVAVAPGKVILYGEHFVVYNVPAIVMAIDRVVKVTTSLRDDKLLRICSDLGFACEYENGNTKPLMGGKKSVSFLEPVRIAVRTVLEHFDEKKGLSIDVHSTIPSSVGLGSSGAISVATVAAVSKILGHEIDKEQIWRMSLQAERYVHVTPSGIDPLVSTYGGLLVWRIQDGSKPKRINYDIDLVVGNTGIQRSTGKLVSAVGKKKDKKVEGISQLMGVMSWISNLALKAFKEMDLVTLGALMNMNHELLKVIGVSHESLDRLVEATRKAGALGSKLTGGGGGGCMISLTTPSKRSAVCNAIEKNGGQPMVVKKYNAGVKVWLIKS
ncbi:MAG: mevalonate kinase [Nitrososphaerota archaeon]|nr:mevalonate kinase [Aigarchaeota archaeon]MDW8077097.1 mevalonate kinase [Nitrososphaerota archaeon]